MLYCVNIIADHDEVELIDREIRVEDAKLITSLEQYLRPDGEEPLLVMYGSPSGVTALVAADDEDDVERTVIRTFGLDCTIDDLQESVGQLPEDEAFVRATACPHCGSVVMALTSDVDGSTERVCTTDGAV